MSLWLKNRLAFSKVADVKNCVEDSTLACISCFLRSFVLMFFVMFSDLYLLDTEAGGVQYALTGDQRGIRPRSLGGV